MSESDTESDESTKSIQRRLSKLRRLSEQRKSSIKGETKFSSPNKSDRKSSVKFLPDEILSPQRDIYACDTDNMDDPYYGEMGLDKKESSF